MSTAINPTHSSAPAPSRASSTAANHAHLDSSYANGHHHPPHDAGGSQSSGSANAAKKGKQKKATDPNEASKLIAAKISQLELDAAGEKDQEAEIGLLRPFSFISVHETPSTKTCPNNVAVIFGESFAYEFWNIRVNGIPISLPSRNW